MSRIRQIGLRVATVAVPLLTLLAACSTNGDAPPVDPKVAALCASACRSVAPCFKYQEPDRPPFKDFAGCERQCAVEIDGRGFLAKDVAKLVMTYLAEAEAKGGDIDCKLEAGFLQFGGDKYLSLVGDPAYLEKCTDEAVKVCGTDLRSRGGWRTDCFFKQYRYNAAVRKGYEACSEIGDCRAWSICREKASRAVTGCEGWFGPDGAKCTVP